METIQEILKTVGAIPGIEYIIGIIGILGVFKYVTKGNNSNDDSTGTKSSIRSGLRDIGRRINGAREHNNRAGDAAGRAGDRVTEAQGTTGDLRDGIVESNNRATESVEDIERTTGELRDGIVESGRESRETVSRSIDRTGQVRDRTAKARSILDGIRKRGPKDSD